MYLMYVDESGDTGLNNSPTDIFVLSGLVIHELRWHDCLARLVLAKRQICAARGLFMREELHASELISKKHRLPRKTRLAMVRDFARCIAQLPDASIINICVDKRAKPEGYDVFYNAWRALIQRFENTISRRNFPGPANPDERGMLFPDHTDDKKLRRLVRKLRRYNPIPYNQHISSIQGHRNVPLTFIIEDPNYRRSSDSYFVQAVDTAAYLLRQSIEPNRYMRRWGGSTLFNILDPILCRHASNTNQQGIVVL